MMDDLKLHQARLAVSSVRRYIRKAQRDKDFMKRKRKHEYNIRVMSVLLASLVKELRS